MFKFRLSLKQVSVVAMLLLSVPVRAEAIDIYIRDDVYLDYQQFVNGRDIMSIDNFSGKTIRRDVVDMVIAQQALLLGGFKHQFVYIPGKLNFRNTKMLENGKLLISFDSYWLEDAKKMQDSLYISEPLIRNGEYIAGIYTSPNRKEVLAIKDIEDLSVFTAVSTPKWSTDWQTLTNLPLKNLIREDEWLSQVRMVDIGWVDFMLMAFHSTKDKSFTVGKISLIPVEGVGIELKDSRHIVISKNHPLGAQAFKAVNKGLALLREQQRIARAYRQAGFFVDTQKIKILNE